MPSEGSVRALQTQLPLKCWMREPNPLQPSVAFEGLSTEQSSFQKILSKLSFALTWCGRHRKSTFPFPECPGSSSTVWELSPRSQKDSRCSLCTAGGTGLHQEQLWSPLSTPALPGWKERQNLSTSLSSIILIPLPRKWPNFLN